MDWKYKHFNQQAVYSAPRQDVLEVARQVVGESFASIRDTSAGFAAEGFSAFHPASANVSVMPAGGGTQVSVELLVERLAMRGYMLVDIGGYYNGLIDKWFMRIAERLAGAPQPVLLSKTTPDTRALHGCAAGCIAWVLIATCLGVVAVPLDRAFFPQVAGTYGGPFGLTAGLIGLLVAIAAFLYVMTPDAPLIRDLRARVRAAQERRS